MRGKLFGHITNNLSLWVLWHDISDQVQGDWADCEVEREEYSAGNLIFRLVLCTEEHCVWQHFISIDTDLNHLDHEEEAEGEGAEDQEHRAEGDKGREVSRHLSLALTLLLEANISTVEGSASISN